MIVTLEEGLDENRVQSIVEYLSEKRYAVTSVRTQDRSYLIAIGKDQVDLREVALQDGVKDVHRVSDSYKLVSRKWKATQTAIELRDGISIKEGDCSLLAGPCSIEDEQQVDDVLAYLKSRGVRLMRGGAFKPRTSPYSFRGLGLEGLKMWYQKAKEAGIAIVTEVVSPAHVEPMYDYVDMYQVGTRNSQNFELLAALGEVDKPVLLKRAMSGTLDELLQSAEYIFSSGNERLVLCERGIRTFEKAYRNTLDLNAIPVLKEKTHLPVIVDPSHGIGVRRWVEPMALAAVMAGADGLIFEIHKTPEEAASDAQQTLSFDESDRLIAKVRELVALRESL
ncbi:MAG: 3-deoxy-7-phosphoheptulonate synthase [Bdellovibrionales bacterium]|nr:3-deoxy-7-phosphoheptulonate synthase [Bdellovibrionales bacterium]